MKGFAHMIKTFTVRGVKFVISQDAEGWLKVGFDGRGSYLLSPTYDADAIAALGFPTEPPEWVIEHLGEAKEATQ